MDSSEEGKNPRQAAKREGDHEEKEDGEPVPKRMSPAELSDPQPPIPPTSQADPPVPPKSQDQLPVPPSPQADPPVPPSPQANPPVPPEVPADTTGEELTRIFDIIEQAAGHSMIGLARLFNEQEGLNYILNLLRRALQYHQGHLSPLIEGFRQALGPVVESSSGGRITRGQRSGTAETNSSPLTERSGREILGILGQVLQLWSDMMNTAGFGNRDARSIILDNNSIAEDYADLIMEVGESIQHLFRNDLKAHANRLEIQLPGWKLRVRLPKPEPEPSPQATANGSTTPVLPQRIIQNRPRDVYPAIDEPRMRFQIEVPTSELLPTEPEMSSDHYENVNDINFQSETSLSRAEENLRIRYGALELLNGIQKVQVDYKVLGITCKLTEMYISNGWINSDKKNNEGQYVRTLNFDIGHFQKGSVIHRVHIRSAVFDEENKEIEARQVFIRISGIVCSDESKAAEVNGQRAEFVFKLPSHLTMNQINDGGIREGILKIQFLK